MPFDLLNVDKQLTFYGAYHTNKTNILIHTFCVPLIVWSFQTIVAPVDVPFLPAYRHVFNNYLVFDMNIGALMSAIYIVYYFLLEPVAAFLYIPQMIFTLLTSTAYSTKQNSQTVAWCIFIGSWLAQFVGHGFAEGRAPALLDNLLGAAVLGPFFVHLENLYNLGYRPEMHKRINNAIGVEVARIRRLEADKKRAKAN